MPSPKRPAYPAEFKSEAVRLGRSTGVDTGHPIDGVAHDFGIARESLRRWIKRAEIDPAGPRA